MIVPRTERRPKRKDTWAPTRRVFFREVVADIRIILSPRWLADHGSEVLANGDIKRGGNTGAGRAPSVDLLEVERGVLVRNARPILMRDGVAPIVQVVQGGSPLRLPAVDEAHVVPKAHPQPSEVGAQVPRVGIAVVELPSLRQHGPQDAGNGAGLRVRDQEVDGLRVEVAAEPLELRRQQHSVSVIELQRRVPTTAPRNAERTMSGGDLRERCLARPILIPKSNRRHLSPH
jgi:hypothetical protein